MKTFLIADTHFGDENIVKYEQRPFANAAEMTEKLVENWNKVVSDDDIVFVVGDYSNLNFEKTKQITKMLNGKKYLVRGNHDKFSIKEYQDMGFETVYDYPVLVNKYFMLSHEPIYVNKLMPYVNVYGHIHNNPNYNTYSFCGHCVSVEKIDYTPIDIEEVNKRILSIRNKYEIE